MILFTEKYERDTPQPTRFANKWIDVFGMDDMWPMLIYALFCTPCAIGRIVGELPRSSGIMCAGDACGATMCAICCRLPAFCCLAVPARHYLVPKPDRDDPLCLNHCFWDCLCAESPCSLSQEIHEIHVRREANWVDLKPPVIHGPFVR